MNHLLNPELALQELISHQIIDKEIVFKPFTGGTVSSIGCIYVNQEPTYVLKINDPLVLQAEVEFLTLYDNLSILPKLKYVDQAFRFIFYHYMPGNVVKNIDKASALKMVTSEFLAHVKPIESGTLWGYMDEPVLSWSQFIETRVRDAYLFTKEVLPEEDYRLMLTLSYQENRLQDSKPYMIHGDFGIHNFLFENKQLTSIIDSTPVYGPPIYDLVYAYCSTPYDLNKETILTSANVLSIYDELTIVEEVLLGLFYRIRTCIRVHPEDLPSYLQAWEYWKKEYESLK